MLVQVGKDCAYAATCKLEQGAFASVHYTFRNPRLPPLVVHPRRPEFVMIRQGLTLELLSVGYSLDRARNSTRVKDTDHVPELRRLEQLEILQHHPDPEVRVPDAYEVFRTEDMKSRAPLKVGLHIPSLKRILGLERRSKQKC